MKMAIHSMNIYYTNRACLSTITCVFLFNAENIGKQQILQNPVIMPFMNHNKKTVRLLHKTRMVYPVELFT